MADTHPHPQQRQQKQQPGVHACRTWAAHAQQFKIVLVQQPAEAGQAGQGQAGSVPGVLY
jgi:hypothetical protein